MKRKPDTCKWETRLVNNGRNPTKVHKIGNPVGNPAEGMEHWAGAHQ
eukprot:COSAG02_NODE_53771_length_299_cov_2.780000_1_plen_46_part_01